MAVVQMNKELKNIIVRELSQTYDRKITIEQNKFGDINIAEQCYARLVPQDFIDRTESVKDIWPNWASSLYVTIPDYDDIARNDLKSRSFGSTAVTAYFKTAVRIPQDFESHVKLDRSLPAYREAADIAQRIYLLKDERHNLIGGVLTVLDKCRTLGQVIEIWPNVVEYLPEYAKTQHETVREKVKAVAKPKPELSESVKTSLIKIRMCR